MFRHKTAPAAAPIATAPLVVPNIVPVAPAPPGPILAVPLVATTTATMPQQQQQAPAGGGLLNKVKEVLPDPSKISNAVKSTAQSMTSSDTTAPTQATITPLNPPVTMIPVTEYVQTTTQAPLSAEMPVNFVKEERSAVIKEKILPVEEESIQPVIHREVEKREIHEILQPIHERQVLPPTYEERQLQAEYRPVVGGYTQRQAISVAPSVEYAPKERTQIVKPPIIEETVRKTIIEEVQPVIHREVVKPHIIRQTQDIYEKILEPEVVVKETRPMIESAEQTFTGFKEQVAPLPAMTTGTKYVFEIDQKTKLKPLGTTNDVNLGTYQTYSYNTFRAPGAK